MFSKVKSKWVNGNLVFYDKAGAIIATFDGENRKITLPSGAVLDNAASTVKCGVGTLDGTNPTAIATGLTTVTSFVATLKGSAAPGDSTMVLTATVSGGTASVYAWKTDGSDPTLIASAGTEEFFWIAVGTL